MAIKVALYDFDGTITSKDCFTEFIIFAVSRRRKFLGILILWPFILLYKLRMLEGTFLRRLVVRIAFRGAKKGVLESKGQQFAAEVIPGYLNLDVLKQLKCHQANNFRIVVVSASLNLYLKPWCNEYGADLIGNELEATDGILTGKYTRPDCSGLQKAVRVLELYGSGGFEIAYAYGNSHEDRELMGLAKASFLVSSDKIG